MCYEEYADKVFNGKYLSKKEVRRVVSDEQPLSFFTWLTSASREQVYDILSISKLRYNMVSPETSYCLGRDVTLLEEALLEMNEDFNLVNLYVYQYFDEQKRMK